MLRNIAEPRMLVGLVLLVFVPAVGVFLLQPAPSYSDVSPLEQPPTCTQPMDIDIAFAFCDAAYDDIANEYTSPLVDTGTDGYIPPIILKAIGAQETGWTQCGVDGTPINNNGCAWGLMQIYAGMDCYNPFNEETRERVKYDYRYNIAMGAFELRKWHWDVRSEAGCTIGDGSPDITEHWYYAVWSYGEGGWAFESCPNNQLYDGCQWPTSSSGCAYVDKVWWKARNPPSRSGYTFYSPVDLTRPNPSDLPRSIGEWTSWDCVIGDPTPVHRDSCRACLPSVVRAYPPCAKPIQDGGFEDLGWSYWTRNGTTHSTIAYSGSYSAWLAGVNNRDDTVYQQVTIPAFGPENDPVESVLLQYVWHMTTDETSTAHDYDHFYARIRNTGGGTLRDLEHQTNRSVEDTWVLSSFDVSEFKGQTVQVFFEATTDYSLPTSFYVDDVVIYACEGG
jgi:hypothetical protein